MSALRNRREFLGEVGQGVLLATIGSELAGNLGLASTPAEAPALAFGSLERLVGLMQETPAEKLLPALVAEMRAGTDLRRLTAAAALANARTFGGEDYVGFHTLMALSPAYTMSQELPAESQALPVFKVLYRNTSRIQERGGRKAEVLRTVEPETLPANARGGELLRDAIRQKNTEGAERMFAALAQGGPDQAFNELLLAVHDHTEVHRVVLPYRAWDLLGVVGPEHAHTLLRQSVRYCVRAESWSRAPRPDDPRTVLPKVLEEHGLLAKQPGDRRAEDSWIEAMSQTIFNATPEQAAQAMGAALAEGMRPDDAGHAISLAANQLVLRDQGRPPSQEVAGKPIGSVHGDSIGVHASDSANAWRNMARVTNHRNCFASLILGAYQLALDRVERGGEFTKWQPLPVQWQLDRIKATEPERLLSDLDEAIRGNLQAHASAIVHRCGELGHPHRPVFDLLLRYAVSEDGALHAEKFYRTVSEEFAASRAPFRWRYLVGLARVTASEFGRPAPGLAEARSLLKV